MTFKQTLQALAPKLGLLTEAQVEAKRAKTLARRKVSAAAVQAVMAAGKPTAIPLAPGCDRRTSAGRQADLRRQVGTPPPKGV